MRISPVITLRPGHNDTICETSLPKVEAFSRSFAYFDKSNHLQAIDFYQKLSAPNI